MMSVSASSRGNVAASDALVEASVSVPASPAVDPVVLADIQAIVVFFEAWPNVPGRLLFADTLEMPLFRRVRGHLSASI